MKVLIVSVILTFSQCIYAQLFEFVGDYYIAVVNDESNELVIEENCWTGEPDVISIAYDEVMQKYLLIFKSFHNQTIQINFMEKKNTSIICKGYDPDDSEYLIRKYELQSFKEQEIPYLILNEDYTTEYVLIPFANSDLAQYKICAEENELDESALYELSKKLFTSIVNLDQETFGEFTNDNGFKFMFNQSESQLLTIGQLFENSGFSSWFQYVRGRSTEFSTLDTFTPFDHCEQTIKRPTLMIKRYNQDETTIDIHVWDSNTNPYRLVIGCEINEKWLIIKYIIIDICSE